MAIRRMLCKTWEKIWDAGADAFYFHNTATGEVAWAAPRLLGPDAEAALGERRGASRAGAGQSMAAAHACA